ncbi:cytochrome P450 18a1 [Folsomia candida]|uniref:cytochrome P450 18a1 n=1 Tax=Folsomia candida TaxID=158441 RepID=UPI001604BCD5|nr:cytochrome P450 18a1 [Folsomia candida]
MFSLQEIFLGVTFLLLLWYLLTRRSGKLPDPPGPRGLPLLGNILQMDKALHMTFSKWAKIYGPVVQAHLATTRIAIISDHVILRKIFAQTEYSGRPDFHSDMTSTPAEIAEMKKLYGKSAYGLSPTEGKIWEELRRFTLRQLRDFGFGKQSMEELIMVEVAELIEHLKRFEVGRKPVTDLKEMSILAVANSLRVIVAGKRYRHDDPELLNFTRTAEKALQDLLENAGLLFFVPWLGKSFPRLTGYAKLKERGLEFLDSFQKPVKEHLETYSPENIRDFIDAYIKEMKTVTDPDSPFYGKRGEKNLEAIFGDFYIGGTDTTTSMIVWMVFILSKFSEYQEQFQNEIKSVTGNNRACQLSDKSSMPFTEALTAETFRFATVSPFGLQHRTTSDQELNGFLIRKDTLIFPNYYFMHHDPAIWGDPETFRPSRFLDKERKTFVKNPALIAFGTGRRVCIGESFARDSIFLFVTNLFQRFSIAIDKNGPDNGFATETGFALVPKPFHILLKDRLE